MTHQVSIRVHVSDVEKLHRDALVARLICGDSLQDALAHLGGADSPNVANCILELIADSNPGACGFEAVSAD